LIGLRIDLEQGLALSHALIVLHRDGDHLTADAGIDRILPCTHERIVGRDIEFLRNIIGRPHDGQKAWRREHERSSHPCPQGAPCIKAVRLRGHRFVPAFQH
jgi:hypothetical protein